MRCHVRAGSASLVPHVRWSRHGGGSPADRREVAGARCRSRVSTASSCVVTATPTNSPRSATVTYPTDSPAASEQTAEPEASTSSVIGMSWGSSSTIERLERAADSGTGVRFVGNSVAPDGPMHVSWRQVHDEARSVGAALQAKGLLPGDHVAVLGPTSRELITIVRGCWMAGIASMVLPLPMRMGSLDEFVNSTRARHPPRRRQAGADRRPARPVLRTCSGRPADRADGSRAARRARRASGRPSRGAALRPRAAGHPAVHQRVHE